MSELKPCPFCGSTEIKSKSTGGTKEWATWCSKCGAGFNIVCYDQEFSERAWNKRTPPPLPEQAEEQWRELGKDEQPQFGDRFVCGPSFATWESGPMPSFAKNWQRLAQPVAEDGEEFDVWWLYNSVGMPWGSKESCRKAWLAARAKGGGFKEEEATRKNT